MLCSRNQGPMLFKDHLLTPNNKKAEAFFPFCVFIFVSPSKCEYTKIDGTAAVTLVTIASKK